ncbi:MAG TPA: glycosyltransferase [Candidatus Blautia stercoravium]|nr:glycosyltransferase [Candidatus Blautia stercoravium]
MKTKFILSICFGGLWLVVSLFLAIGWAQEISCVLPDLYVWWVIVGIALLPGYLMSTMFFSNLLNWKLKKYSDTQEDTTIIMCAHNEQETIVQSIQSITAQQYKGHIRLLVVDNASTDHTKQEILKLQETTSEKCSVEYVYCGNHIVSFNGACVAGNLFVHNPKVSLVTKMQNYDYLLSIAAIKRFQGSYQSTLVAQGAFSAYQTEAVRTIGGWQDVLGEDIVLTYQLLQQGLSSTYEPGAAGYTTVPETLDGLYNQWKLIWIYCRDYPCVCGFHNCIGYYRSFGCN